MTNLLPHLAPPVRRGLTLSAVVVTTAAVTAVLTVGPAPERAGPADDPAAGTVDVTLASKSRERSTAPLGEPRNIIVMIGDGMGESHVHATQLHYQGRDGRLAMQQMPVYSQMTTYSANNPVTDSAAASTALASGVLTNNGVIGRDAAGRDVLDQSILLRAQDAGMSTGLVTEVPLGHATPAGFAASVPNRNDLPEISRQYLQNRVDVLLGGGEQDFLPTGVRGEHCATGRRTDGQNLVRSADRAGYRVVTDAEELAELPAGPRGRRADRVLGLFACAEMSHSTAPDPDEPTSAEKTEAALDVLSRDRDGFFLMVERGKIDWTAEANDLPGTLAETKDFDDAVAVARAYVRRNPDTLLVVTADHEAGGMAIAPGPSDRRGPGLRTDTTTTEDGLPLHVRWATQPGHTAAPVGVRFEGRGSGFFRNEWNGDEHLVDLPRRLAEIAGLD